MYELRHLLFACSYMCLLAIERTVTPSAYKMRVSLIHVYPEASELFQSLFM
jgi:hypothetical protein